eukprot:NODE_6052_length_532_cov_360.635220.p2 GENE.NODE_6052_length_532_cov_360.635220~~NODE_6052_length_532_cov_360.635220.p2  ORF type:complete len:150 (+),score=49.00 NODE_6052_length_532_cov_360.635220:17-466(+)
MYSALHGSAIEAYAKFSSESGETNPIVKTYLRIVLTTVVKVWLKVSLLADTFDSLTTTAALELSLAIAVSLLAKMQELWANMTFLINPQFYRNRHFDYVEWSFPQKARHVVVTGLPLIFAFAAIVAKIAGIFACTSHILNITTGCYNAQ